MLALLSRWACRRRLTKSKERVEYQPALFFGMEVISCKFFAELICLGTPHSPELFTK